MSLAIKVEGLTKTFSRGKALDIDRLQVSKGEMVALIGASGSGKSTLLRHMAGLVAADRNERPCGIDVLGATVQRQGRIAKDIRRTRSRIGFIFQQFNLVGRLPVMTNVLTGALGRVPAWRSLSGSFAQADRKLAFDALSRVGMADYVWQRASTLSGGQQQRAAIARALVQRAEVILADEPIASLDPEASRRVMESLAKINREDGTTIVVSLHQVEFAIRFCPRTVALKGGLVVFDGPSSQLTPAMLKELYGAEAEELTGYHASSADAFRDEGVMTGTYGLGIAAAT